ncbi:hypothetical protein JCM30204_35520 [Dysgonomonas termitidis]|uniref:DUF3408 domain-containing protein n=2 Tax=Dysgonomonas termitidis TaxID=1516126 RepID=A0ABV9L0L4_9BACT
MQNKKREPDNNPLLNADKDIYGSEYKENNIKRYSSLFLIESDKIARHGKSVNIRPEFHACLSLLLKISTDSNISLFSYIDNVLKTHLDDYQEIIDELLEDSLKQKLPSKKR